MFCFVLKDRRLEHVKNVYEEEPLITEGEVETLA